MNDRLVTLLGALGALALFVVLVMPPSREPDVSRPVSTASGPNGYAGLQRWIAASDVPDLSLKRRLPELENMDLTDTGNVLLTTMPHAKALRTDEISWLRRWLVRGNTLLILAALNDTPDWSLLVATQEFIDNIAALTGLSLQSVTDEDGNELRLGEPLATSAVTFEANTAHPLMYGVRRLEGETDTVASIWQPDTAWEFYVALASESSSGTGALWQVPVGSGTIVLSASGSLLTNRALGKADNAAFFANVLARHLRPGGRVIFDDMHQGLTELYDPEAFFSDARLGKTLLFLLAFWLLYVVGTSGRLAPPRTATEPPRQSDLVQAVGNFMARKLAPATAGRMMVDTWLADLHASGRISTVETSAWRELAGMPLVDGATLNAVSVAYERLGRGEKVDLTRLHNHLQKLRRTLA